MSSSKFRSIFPTRLPRVTSALILCSALLGGCSPPSGRSLENIPPETPRQDIVDNIHGVQVHDPYRWLEDQRSPETRKWIESENRYTEDFLGRIGGKQELEQEIARLMQVDSVQLPFQRNGRLFFLKRKAGQDLAMIYERDGLEGVDKVLVDPLPFSKDHTVSVTVKAVSHDGRLLLYGARNGGEDELTLHFLKVDSGAELDDRLPRGRYSSTEFSTDSKRLYYSKYTAEGPRIYVHALGTNQTGDRQIFGDQFGPGNLISFQISPEGAYLLIRVAHGSAALHTELYLMDLRHGWDVRPIVTDVEAPFYGVLAGPYLFIRTNWNALNGRILRTTLKHPEQKYWQEIVPERDNVVIRGLSAAGGRLFVNLLREVRSEVDILDPDGRKTGELASESLGSFGTPRGPWKGHSAFYTFTSYSVPRMISHLQTDSGVGADWFKPDIPFDSNRYQVKQVWYPSKDGTQIPMFIAFRKGIRLDGSNPTLLTGYGGFNISRLPSFSARTAVWLSQGGVLAVPSLRGGGEFGEKWHRAGMLENKQNVFDDFIAAAQWLIDNKYTQPSRLAIEGASNGGLLVGAVMTERPDLFQAVVCRYPLLDMVRYHKFLVARFWVPEYGSSENASQFKTLYAYSPYHHVSKGTNYPALLFVSGDFDTRVAPLHARKMTALMQASSTLKRPVLLLYDTKSGHSGGRPVSQQIDELAKEMLFLKHELSFTP